MTRLNCQFGILLNMSIEKLELFRRIPFTNLDDDATLVAQMVEMCKNGTTS
jgi:hypothetical protein